LFASAGYQLIVHGCGKIGRLLASRRVKYVPGTKAVTFVGDHQTANCDDVLPTCRRPLWCSSSNRAFGLSEPKVPSRWSPGVLSAAKAQVPRVQPGYLLAAVVDLPDEGSARRWPVGSTMWWLRLAEPRRRLGGAQQDGGTLRQDP
jgi:hypothetical protein